MEYEMSIDNLNIYGVSVKKQGYITMDGVTYNVGEPHRKAYSNSIEGRAELQEEVSDPYYSAIMAVWGNEATVTYTYKE